jgi:hypothetical protein
MRQGDLHYTKMKTFWGLLSSADLYSVKSIPIDRRFQLLQSVLHLEKAKAVVSVK